MKRIITSLVVLVQIIIGQEMLMAQNQMEFLVKDSVTHETIVGANVVLKGVTDKSWGVTLKIYNFANKNNARFKC